MNFLDQQKKKKKNQEYRLVCICVTPYKGMTITTVLTEFSSHYKTFSRMCRA